MPAAKTKLIQTLVDADTYRKIQTLARDEGTSVAAVLRRLALGLVREKFGQPGKSA